MAKLKENINRPLAAILTINTVANTVGAAGVVLAVLPVPLRAPQHRDGDRALLRGHRPRAPLLLGVPRLPRVLPGHYLATYKPNKPILG